MKALGLAWIGVFPVRFDDTVAFLCDVAGLSMFESEPDAAHLVTARGDMVEVFRPEARYDFATTGPIPGFLVEDVEVAIDDLRGAAVELLGSGRWRDDAWQHFRAPDGFVYEVKSGPYDPSGPGAGLAWAGARSPHAREMADFAEHVLGMQRTGEEAAMVHLRMPNGDGFEVFLPEDTDHAFMHTGPVVAFGVEDLDAALAKLDSYRAELFMGGIRTDGTDRWVHFRAPDGCVYELFQRG